MQSASMGVQITIRDVPEKVRDELAARAALQGKSMQEFLRESLIQISEKPSIDIWLAEVKAMKAASGSNVPAAKILKARKSDQK